MRFQLANVGLTTLTAFGWFHHEGLRHAGFAPTDGESGCRAGTAPDARKRLSDCDGWYGATSDVEGSIVVAVNAIDVTRL